MGPDHGDRAVDVQDADPASLLNWMRQCLALRKKHAALVTGRLDVVEVGESLIAFTRETGSERLLCAFNLGNVALAWRPDGDWAVIASANHAAPDGSLPPFSGFIARKI